MRILCLHGQGTSGAILKTQLEAIRDRLGDSFEFIYIDGGIESDRFPGLSELIPGPFFKWFTGLTPDKVKETHDFLADVIMNDGPFDGIIGFSAGASLAAGFLLQQEIENPCSPPPVKFAVLLSPAGAALSPDAYCNENLFNSLTPKDLDVLKRVVATDRNGTRTGTTPTVTDYMDHPKSDQQQQKFLEILAEALCSGDRDGMIDGVQSLSDLTVTDSTGWNPENAERYAMPRVLHPLLLPQRIKVPCVISLGIHDTEDVVKQVEVCKDFFRKDSIQILHHAGAHNVPRGDDVETTVVCIYNAIEQSYINLI